MSLRSSTILVCLTDAPEYVVVPPRSVASGVVVVLLAADVVLHQVVVRPLLDVHALVSVGGERVTAHDVVGRSVGATFPLYSIHEMDGNSRQCN